MKSAVSGISPVYHQDVLRSIGIHNIILCRCGGSVTQFFTSFAVVFAPVLTNSRRRALEPGVLDLAWHMRLKIVGGKSAGTVYEVPFIKP